MSPTEIISTTLYLRLTAELWLIALAVYSLRALFSKNPMFGLGLLIALITLFITTAVTYFVPDTQLSRYITSLTFTPGLFLFAVLWMLALIFKKDNGNGKY